MTPAMVQSKPASTSRLRAAGGESRLALPAGGCLVLGARTLIMGVINVTPDSFSDGGRFSTTAQAVAHALHLEATGADILDIGGESTRPDADEVTAGEENRRVLPVIEALAERARVPISIDTTKPQVATAALAAGASIVNDVSMLRHGPGLAEVAAAGGAPLILMHSRGTPTTMRVCTDYPDGIVDTVIAELASAIGKATRAGLAADHLMVDPGIGFAKTAEQCLDLLAQLDALAALERPVVVGVSRKSFIGHVLDLPAGERLEGTLAAETAAILRGARILRTHDVAASRRAATLADALRTPPQAPETEPERLTS